MNFAKFLRKPFLYKTPPVAASVLCNKATCVSTFKDYKLCEVLTHSFPVHPFSTPLRFSYVFRAVEKGCIGNEWVNLNV